MGKNTVTISLERFDELRDLETAINDNKAFIKTSFNGRYSYSESVEIISQDEAVKKVTNQLKEYQDEITELKNENLELSSKLNDLKLDYAMLESDHKMDIRHIKNMSVFEFLRYRRKG